MKGFGSHSPRFGVVKTHVHSGTRRQPLRGLGSQATTASTNADDLVAHAEAIRLQLDRVITLLDQAVAQGVVSADALAHYADQRDALLAGYTRLVESAATAANGNMETLGAWLAELDRLYGEAQALGRSISTAAIAASSSRIWTIAIWTGVGVAAVVGALLGLRWYMNRRRR